MATVSIVSALMNGALWASIASAVWLRLTAPKEDIHGRQQRAGMGVLAFIGAAIVGLIAHLVITNELQIPPAQAIEVWGVGFAVTTALLMGAAFVVWPSRPPPRSYQEFLGGTPPSGANPRGLAIANAMLVAVLFAGGSGVLYNAVALQAPPPKVPQQSSVTDDSTSPSSTYSDAVVRAAAIKAVTETLADPSSAKFRRVFVRVQSTGSKAVCGEVNSKNHMGGRSGFQHFISAGVGQYTWLEEEVADFGKAWDQICVGEVATVTPEPSLAAQERVIAVPSDLGATYRLV